MKRHDAFTMTELVVLVPVTALVGALLLASLGDAQQKLKAAACLNNMRQWGLALNLYANDYNDYWPYEGAQGSSICAGSNSKAWYNVVPPYLHQPTLCQLYSATPPNPPTPFTKGIWTCPSVTNTSLSPGSLSVQNPYFMYNFNNRMDPNGPDQYKRSQLISPTNTIVFAEGNEDPFPSTNGQYCPQRHFGGGNFVFGDGHADYIKFQDYCRAGNPGCSSLILESNATLSGDWNPHVKFHWFPFPSMPT